MPNDLPESLSVDVPQASPLIVPDIVMEKVPELKIHISDALGQPMIATDVIVAVQSDDRIFPFEKLKTTSDGSVSTPLDFIEGEKRMRKRDPRHGGKPEWRGLKLSVGLVPVGSTIDSYPSIAID